MKNVLVTGGAGFIGSSFVRYLLRTHDYIRVVTYDKLTYAGNLENLAEVEVHPRHAFVRGDIGDLITALKALVDHRIDTVVNFAAETHNDRGVLDPAGFYRTNVLGTQTLLEACRKVGVERFHHVSTDEVYGSLEFGDPAWKEGTPYRPRSPYSSSKAASDHVVMAYHHTFGLPATVSNCANNYGPYQFPEKLIPLFATNAMEGKLLPLFQSSKNSREWIHCDDHSAAVDLILRQGKVGETYHIGTGVEKTVEEITDLILGTLDKPPSLKTYVPDRPGHDKRYLLDSTKIRTELGWAPAMRFEEGIRQTIEWYRDHPQWWQRVKDGSYQTYYDTYYRQKLGAAI